MSVPLLSFRFATEADCPRLAELNHQLIRDEGHRNRMTVPELEKRMRRWLGGEYRAVLFEQGREAVAYALYRVAPDGVYLRQFFVHRQFRRRGIGRAALEILVADVFPPGRRVTVDVLVPNQTAHDFWLALGFRDYAVTLEMLRDEPPPTSTGP
jgi:GNAT superfamily N-acetyltransferase